MKLPVHPLCVTVNTTQHIRETSSKHTSEAANEAHARSFLNVMTGKTGMTKKLKTL